MARKLTQANRQDIEKTLVDACRMIAEVEASMKDKSEDPELAYRILNRVNSLASDFITLRQKLLTVTS